MKRLKSFAWEIWLPIVLIIAWLVLSAGSKSFYFPALSSILQKTQEVWFFNGIVENMLPSLVRILAGFLLGSCSSASSPAPCSDCSPASKEPFGPCWNSSAPPPASPSCRSRSSSWASATA